MARTNLSRHVKCILCLSRDLRPLPYSRIELVTCSACGLVFDHRIPTDRALADAYEAHDYTQEHDSAVTAKRQRELVLDFESYRQTNRILDVGCGGGGLLDQARDLNWETFGTEFSQSALQSNPDKGHHMHSGPLDPNNYHHDLFDVVVYSEVLEHLNEPLPEVTRVRQVLRPGGLLYATTPNFNSLDRRILGQRYNLLCYPHHLVYFTPRTLRRLMATAGFKTSKLITTGVSVTRLAHSLVDPEITTRVSEGSADEQIRHYTESNSLLNHLKSMANRLLTVTATGNTLRGWFINCESSTVFR